MARRKIATTVYITPEQERELKALHARTKVPIAEYIRQGIDMVLSKHRRHLPGQLDLYRDHLSVVSEASEGLRKAAEEKRR
jgi:hypothetical protein